MESIFVIIVGILFVLAISDLIVGVSNDAVNFLVSAIGSKSAPFWVIMVIASLGVIFGATFSSGMMEVARKSIFNPQMFAFKDIMFIFLAVMLTDIILLDVFNTFGLPTSTTVSIVFELLGAAVAMSLIKISASDAENITHLANYINSSKALAIITGILLSVVIAFTVGAIVQYISRLVFSFNFKKTLKYFGALWGGIAIAAITYFILIKGLKGSSFADYKIEGVTLTEWIKDNAVLLLIISFVFWTVLLQLLHWIFKTNVLKVIVLVGTFALAMAFAGNDLVNFVGVPIAGLEAFKEFAGTVGEDPATYQMDALQEKIPTDPLYLLISGLIMVGTLWLSKKSKSVTETSLDLSRQEAGYERFGSSGFSRVMVRSFVTAGKVLEKITPPVIMQRIENRFDQKKAPRIETDDAPAFDLVRASVNLVVASILISIATSIKLPLSTTYVTFMVAMGTSLADGAWGRESAVYRITGVISVIGGWFVTALVAFTVAFCFVYLINLGEQIAVWGLFLTIIVVVLKTRSIHRKRMKKKQKELEFEKDIPELRERNIFERCVQNVSTTLSVASQSYSQTINSLIDEDRKGLKNALRDINELDNETRLLKNNLQKTILKLSEDSIETGPYYVQIVEHLREIKHCLYFISNPSMEHVGNHHKPLTQTQVNDLRDLSAKISVFLDAILILMQEHRFTELSDIMKQKDELTDLIAALKKRQIKRMKKNEGSTKPTLLYFDILTETKNLLLNVISLLKAQRDFVNSHPKEDFSKINSEPVIIDDKVLLVN